MWIADAGPWDRRPMPHSRENAGRRSVTGPNCDPYAAAEFGFDYHAPKRGRGATREIRSEDPAVRTLGSPRDPSSGGA